MTHFKPILVGGLLALLRCCQLCASDLEQEFADLPRFHYDFRKPYEYASFDSNGYLNIAVKLQELGREKAEHTLRSLATRPDGMKAVALCRMLYVARPGKEFRAPAWGMPWTLTRRDSAEWPLEPIAIVDGVPFLVTRKYTIFGMPESGKDYLDYCIQSCEWNPHRYRSKSQAELEIAYTTLARMASVDLLHAKDWVAFMSAQIRTHEDGR